MAGLAEYAQTHPPSSGDTVANSEVVRADTACSSDATFTSDLVNELEEHIRQPHTNHDTQLIVGMDTNITGSSSQETDEGLEVMGRKVRKLIKGIQGLRHLGVEGLVDPLPKIAVIGDQSSGKSSLIEGISGIKVPRDDDTCTRCPLEINLTNNSDSGEPWVCRVSLYKKFMYGGLRGKTSMNSIVPGSLGPWSAQDNSEPYPFATVYSKDEVQEVLSWAQLATLNPDKLPELYMPGTNGNTSKSMGVKFSPNVVRVDISGPGLPNLAFYDLPGIINVWETDDERYLVDLVENLVREYVQDEDCINLLMRPLTNDAAVSMAASLVTKSGAQARTMGVLTKPDLLPPNDSYKQWIGALSGEKYKIGYGYHVVKNNPDPKVDNATARAQEEAFFKEKEPWSTKLATYRDRFGTLQLQTALSQILSAQILRSLPRIFDQVSIKSASIDAELALLPEPPAENLPAILMRELTTFEHELGQHLDGGSQQFPFQKNWMIRATQFRRILAESRPILLSGDPSQTSTRQKNQVSLEDRRVEMQGTPTPSRGPIQTISLSSDEDEKPCMSQSTPGSGRKRPNVPVTRNLTPQKRAKLSDIPRHGIGRDDRDPRSAALRTGHSSDLRKNFSLSDIRGIILDKSVAGIPNQIHPKVIEEMCQLSIRSWREPLARFLKLTSDMVRGVLTERLDRVFGRWKHTRLYAETMLIVNGFLATTLANQEMAAQRALRLEISKPMTLNAEAQEAARVVALAELEEARRETRIAMKADEQELRGGRQEKNSKGLATQLGADPFTQEVHTMAIVLGYYECAYSRFVDNICQGIQAELLVTCRNNISQKLQDQLGVLEPDANERCAILFAQDPEVEVRRNQLTKDKKTLAKAKLWLDQLTADTPDMDIDQTVFANTPKP